MTKYRVDMNSDMGESFGKYVLGYDDELLKHITSANIACGFHAGDFMVMAKTVEQAIKCNVKVGAHPGYPDLQGFGRRSLKMSFSELKNVILYQIGAMDAIVKSKGGKLGHVKLHGALGNDSHKQAEQGDFTIAEAYGEAVLGYNKDLTILTFASSKIAEKLRSMGIKVAEEVFSDRAYNVDGTLVARNLPGAMITSPDEVVGRLIKMVKEKTIITIDNRKIEGIPVDSICFHGDTKSAADLTKAVREAFDREGIEVKSFRSI